MKTTSSISIATDQELPEHGMPGRACATPLPKALSRRIKRRVIARQHVFFAVTNPGIEKPCFEQLKSLLPKATMVRQTAGGIEFKGSLTECYLANLHCRFAVRILMRIASFKADNFPSLTKKLAQVPWELFIAPQSGLKVKTACHHSRLYHHQAVAQRIAASIKARLGPCNRQPEFTVLGRLESDRLTISLDSSGAPLFKRGLKEHFSTAPLRETTAAAILSLIGYRPGSPLADPMCGSGTFSLEAAMAAKRIPAGWFREFAFFHWPAFRPRHWAFLRRQAAGRIRRLDFPPIRASDIRESLCRLLAQSIANNGLEDAIQVEQADFFSLRPGRKPGLLVLNPPYGRRLERGHDLKHFYRHLAKSLQRNWSGWHLGLLLQPPARVHFRQLGFKERKMFHGGLHTVLLYGKLS